MSWTDESKRFIAIYHKPSLDGKYPEGWYADRVEDVAQEVRYNKFVQNILISKLHQKNVNVQWDDPKLRQVLYHALTGEQLQEEM